MATKVIAQNKAPLDYRQSPHYRNIGRPTVYGNPIRIGEKCQVCGEIHDEAGSTIACFKLYFYDRIFRDRLFRSMVHVLRDKVLVCPGNCKPLPCHGDVIAEYLNKLYDAPCRHCGRKTNKELARQHNITYCPDCGRSFQEGG